MNLGSKQEVGIHEYREDFWDREMCGKDSPRKANEEHMAGLRLEQAIWQDLD